MQIGAYPLNTVIQGDSRELAKSIPDESVDLIFTDPVYENIDDYAWLAETAQRILKPNSACLAFCANRKLYKVQQAMIPPLEYVKVISYQVIKMINGVYQNHFDDKTMAMWTPLLYLEKGISRPSKRTWDYAFTQFGNGDNHHKMKCWDTSQRTTLQVLESHTKTKNI
jgi:hypothetical protein